MIDKDIDKHVLTVHLLPEETDYVCKQFFKSINDIQTSQFSNSKGLSIISLFVPQNVDNVT